MQRTYSRKRNQHRSYTAEADTVDEPSSAENTPVRPRKRQKIDVEVVVRSPDRNGNSTSASSAAVRKGSCMFSPYVRVKHRHDVLTDDHDTASTHSPSKPSTRSTTPSKERVPGTTTPPRRPLARSATITDESPPMLQRTSPNCSCSQVPQPQPVGHHVWPPRLKPESHAACLLDLGRRGASLALAVPANLVVQTFPP